MDDSMDAMDDSRAVILALRDDSKPSIRAVNELQSST